MTASADMTIETSGFSAADYTGDSFTRFHCLSCGATAPPEVFLKDCADYYQRKPLRTDYYRCRSCGLVQAFPLPEDVSRLYEGYAVHRTKSFLYRCIRSLVMRRAYFDIDSALPGSVLLDYGCGDGWFLESCRRRHIRLLGYEPSAVLADGLAARLKLPVYSSLECLVGDFRSKVDVITMHFVLEHLTDLEQAFASMAELLSPRGVCFCTVPNLDSWEARLFGKKWHGLDPPRHICFPQSRVVEDLAKRHGLRLAQARPVAFPNGFAGSIPAVVAGHFTFALYLLALPLGILLSGIAPSGAIAFLFDRKPL